MYGLAAMQTFSNSRLIKNIDKIKYHIMKLYFGVLVNPRANWPSKIPLQAFNVTFLKILNCIVH